MSSYTVTFLNADEYRVGLIWRINSCLGNPRCPVLTARMQYKPKDIHQPLCSVAGTKPGIRNNYTA